MATPTTLASTSEASAWEVWEEEAAETLLDEMRKHRMSYKALSKALERLGIYESAAQLNRKVNRKKFSAAFLLACLEALEPEEEPNARPLGLPTDKQGSN
ncbi:DUF6471 domain-containing protein [Diaphorobacter sp. C33]|uniref:DUF6471 domain-containing protein n=1 Tax=Diaphorobacter nitroreducens TaxID=164759 RepID=A0AAX1WRK2_9BURK|nr:DUF6471 domain-containing protein [Diaphorobacter sp. C33]ROR40294.1 hypothetical protein EDC60_2814 [Diaphorobacter nitroreducens]WKK90199.1 DUF6471 domain-containing protein [Diaphorobacter sp. C33]